VSGLTILHVVGMLLIVPWAHYALFFDRQQREFARLRSACR